jgi:dienelactone hydrolase
MRAAFILAAALGLAACTTDEPQQAARPAAAQPVSIAGVDVLEATWYSEQVQVAGRLYKPSGSTGRLRAVVVAPGWGDTAETMTAYAQALAKAGLVALVIDYRGWGHSGGELYLGERVDTYDKQRFTVQTPEMIIRRGRLDPEHQVQDIRNAITYLQGRAEADPAKIGVLGVDIAGGHVISVMGMDARAKVGVAVTPVIAGAGEAERSFIPSAADRAELIRLAREGRAPRTEREGRARNAQEARLALAEYKPFWRIDSIPQTAAVRFIVAGADREIDNRSNAGETAMALGGRGDVQTIAGAGHDLNAAQQQEAARLAAEFFAGRL